MYKPKPTRLGHIVLKVRDIQASLEFYTQVIGLEVSDWIDDRMVFLRAGTDHHDLALLQLPGGGEATPSGDYPSVEHFSYRVETVEEIMKITEMLQQRNIEIDRGPGRHGPGDNTFIVFRDPDGNNVEFYSDMTIIDEENPYKASVWSGGELNTFDQWGLEKFVVEPPERIKAILPKK
ncbi:MAG: VOC family protein [Pseudomonadales bacterium]